MHPSSPTRIVLIDDHPVVREGIRSFLQLSPNLLVVGEFDHPVPAIAEIRHLRPHIILLDLHFGPTTSIPKIPLFRRETPQAGILIVSCNNEPAIVEDALRAGVDGYLSKDSPPHEYLDAITTVIRQQRYVSAALHSNLRREVEQNPFTGLAPQQKKYAELAASGLATNEIAEIMGIAVSTVASHRKEVLSRLGLPDANALVRLRNHLGV